MSNIIASTEIIGVKDDQRFAITLKIGYPYQRAGVPDSWACPVVLDPLYPRLPDMVGEDSFQALCLAIRLVMHLLSEFKGGGGRLLNEDSSDFPLEAILFHHHCEKMGSKVRYAHYIKSI